MNSTNRIRRFCHAGFIEGMGRIFGSFTPAAGDPIVRENTRRPVVETVKAEWRLIGALLWDSITLFQGTHPDTDFRVQQNNCAGKR